MTDHDQVSSAEERSSGFSLTLAAWIAQLVLTLLGAGHVFLSALSIASCGEGDCDYGAFIATQNAFYLGGGLLLVGSAVIITVFRRRPRVGGSAAVVATLLMCALLAITYAAGREALTLPLFGNRLA